MRKIIHVDMDYFFAQVEERDRPELKGKPVAIGGLSFGRGVLSTSNYEARKYGVKSAMPTAFALKLCPQLILVSSNFHKYREASAIVFNIFRRFSTKVEGLSLDEAFIDVTECQLFNNDAIAIAKEIKRLIFQETGLTASAGVSYNKMLAKIASDLYKPNGLAVIRPENIMNKIAHFDIGLISGVGKVTKERLAKYNIYRFCDLQKYTKLDLINMFGDFGASLFDRVRGLDHRIVESRSERKSLSVEHTYAVDIEKEDELIIKLETCFEEMLERLKKHSDKNIKTIQVKIKYFDFTSTTIEGAYDLNFKSFKKLFLERYQFRKEAVRLIGTGVKFYCRKSSKQLEMELVG